MATWYIDAAATGAADGTTWTDAFTTIAAGFKNNTGIAAGDTVWVAPGVYNESALSPYAAGTRAALCYLKGDYDGSGGSGKTGYVIVDGSDAANGRTNSVDVFVDSNNWAYWNISGFYITGGLDSLAYAPVSAGTTNDSTTISDCVLEGVGQRALSCNTWTIDPDTYAPIKFVRCVIFAGNANTFPYGDSVYLNATKSSSFYTNPQYEFERCILIGNNPVIIIDTSSTLYTKVLFTNCTFYQTVRNLATNRYTVFQGQTTYTDVTAVDCLDIGANVGTSTSYDTATRPQYYSTLSGASGTAATKVPLLPPFPYLFPSSTALGFATTNGTTPDLFGTTVSGSTKEPGAYEYVTGQYPLEPTMDISNLQTGSGGSGILRSKFFKP